MQNQFLYTLIFGIGMLVLAWLIGGNSAGHVVTWYESRDWVETEAEVIRSEFSHHEDSDQDDVYTFNLVYRYEFQDKEYKSSRFALRPVRDRNLNDLSPLLTAHQTGQQIQVWVNPAEPASALVRRGIPGLSWMGLIFGILFGFAGVWIVLAAFRS